MRRNLLRTQMTPAKVRNICVLFLTHICASFMCLFRFGIIRSTDVLVLMTFFLFIITSDGLPQKKKDAKKLSTGSKRTRRGVHKSKGGRTRSHYIDKGAIVDGGVVGNGGGSAPVDRQMIANKQMLKFGSSTSKFDRNHNRVSPAVVLEKSGTKMHVTADSQG